MTTPTPFADQVGGHGDILQTSTGHLLKPLSPKEHAFYLHLQSPSLPSRLHFLRQFTPTFHGSRLVPSSSSSSHPFLILENLTATFIRPCIMDVKLGIRHHDDDASSEKQARLTARATATTSRVTGIRVTGMRTLKYQHHHQHSQQQLPHHNHIHINPIFEHTDKQHGRSLAKHELPAATRWFLHDGHSTRLDVIPTIVQKLTTLIQALSQQTDFFFYAVSLLIIYEGDIHTDHSTCVDIRLIDFAHTVESHGRCDDGILLGLQSLLTLFRDVPNMTGPVMLPIGEGPLAKHNGNTHRHRLPDDVELNVTDDHELPNNAMPDGQTVRD